MCAVPDHEPVCSPDSEAVCLGVFSWLRKWGGGSIAELAPCLTLLSQWHLLGASTGFGGPFRAQL